MFPDFLQSGNKWINDNNAVLVDSCSNFSSSPSLQSHRSLAFLTLPTSFVDLVPLRSLISCAWRGNQAKRPSARSQPLLTNTQPDPLRHLIVLLISATILWVPGHFLHHLRCPANSLATKHSSNCPANGCCHLHNRTAAAGQRQGWYYISL